MEELCLHKLQSKTGKIIICELSKNLFKNLRITPVFLNLDLTSYVFIPINTAPIVPIKHLHPIIWAHKIQVQKYQSYPFRFDTQPHHKDLHLSFRDRTG